MIAIKAFLSKYMYVVAVILLFGVMLGLAYCKGEKAGKSGEVVKQQSREIETQRDLGEANGNAADARVSDAIKAQKQERELTDALAREQDPNRRRALRGCIILRQQGRDTTNIPACR